jgi:hypothetical protein
LSFVLRSSFVSVLIQKVVGVWTTKMGRKNESGMVLAFHESRNADGSRCSRTWYTNCMEAS